MQAVDLVRFALTMTDHGFEALVAGLRSHPMATQAPAGGNHPLWTLGHLTFIESSVPSILFGRPHPLPDYEPLFKMGSTPMNDAGVYPSFDELLATYKEHRQANLKLVDEIGDAGMGRVPAAIPKGFEKEMATFGQTFLVVALHQMVHYGEMADVRRAVGLKPLA